MVGFVFRSTSVSPCRQQMTYNNGMSKYVVGNGSNGPEMDAVGGRAGRKLSSYLLRGLSSCGGGSPDRGRGDAPEPPPRSNRGASPLLVRRGPTSPPDITSSPILNRRLVPSLIGVMGGGGTVEILYYITIIVVKGKTQPH